jgi:hypothetical protein
VGRKKKVTVTFITCTFFNVLAPRGGVAAPKILPRPGGVAAPKILPRPGGRGCAKNPADRKFALSSRFAFHCEKKVQQKFS